MSDDLAGWLFLASGDIRLAGRRVASAALTVRLAPAKRRPLQPILFATAMRCCKGAVNEVDENGRACEK